MLREKSEGVRAVQQELCPAAFLLCIQIPLGLDSFDQKRQLQKTVLFELQKLHRSTKFNMELTFAIDLSVLVKFPLALT